MSSLEIRGIIASQGIQIGKAHIHRGNELIVPKYNIPESWVEDELKRFDRTVQKTKEDITEIVAGPIIEALNQLDTYGIRPVFAERGLT